jgi:hypothetical protein
MNTQRNRNVKQTAIVSNFLSQMFMGFMKTRGFYFTLNLFLYHTNFMSSDELFKLITVIHENYLS